MVTEDTPFFQDRPLYSATSQEAADCLWFIEKLRIVRKLSGFGTITVKIKDQKVLSITTSEEDHRG